MERVLNYGTNLSLGPFKIEQQRFFRLSSSFIRLLGRWLMPY